MYSNQYQNNNICDLDSISVHDIDFDLNNSNQNYGQFTYGDYLQELQELEQGRTPMKIDRQTIPRDLTNLHWLHHNVGLPIDQQTHRESCQQQTITLMVDPNTNMPVQFTTSRTNMQSLPTHDGIAYMTMPQSQIMTSQQHQTPVMFSRHDLHQQQTLLHHQQHQKYGAHEKGKENGTPGHKIFPKPVFSYSCLIAMALRNSEQGSLPVSEIYKYMQSRFPYFKTAPDGWKNSVRHNLSLNKAFCKLERPDGTSQRKGCLWSLKPEKKDQLRREIRKWKKKHPEAIKASMANPDDLSLSSESLDDDSLDDSKTPSPEHTVPESSNIDILHPPTPLSAPTASPLNLVKIKEEPLDDLGVETAAKELFGNDLLFNQDELQSEEFWNELITSSENSNILSNQNRLLSEDLIECDNSLKMEVQPPAISSPTSNFFSSAVQPSTLAGF